MGDLTGFDTLDVVCDNCQLPESSHTFAGGSLVTRNGSYVCNGYSQKKLMTKKDYADSNK